MYKFHCKMIVLKFFVIEIRTHNLQTRVFMPGHLPSLVGFASLRSITMRDFRAATKTTYWFTRDITHTQPVHPIEDVSNYFANSPTLPGPPPLEKPWLRFVRIFFPVRMQRNAADVVACESKRSDW